jgi:hypothetical protein
MVAFVRVSLVIRPEYNSGDATPRHHDAGGNCFQMMQAGAFRNTATRNRVSLRVFSPIYTVTVGRAHNGSTE